MSNLTSNFDESSRQALERAKRALTDNQRLDVGTLLDSVFHATDLKEQPDLAPFAHCFREPQVMLDQNRPVRVDDGLKRVLQGLTRHPRVSPRLLLAALVDSEAGRQVLDERGLDPAQRTALDDLLKPLLATPPAATSAKGTAGDNSTPRAQRRRKVVRDLGEFGTLLTDPESRHSLRQVVADRAVTTLLRHLLTPRSRNVLLVGPPGIGKTSLMHGLALKLLSNDPDLPEPLRELDLFELSPNFPRTSASSFGDFNQAQELQKIRGFLRTLENNPGTVLVVDRFFAFLGMLHRISLHQELFDGFIHSMDSGSVTCIGCLHPEELAKLGELDPSLPRRFRILHLPAPTGDDLETIVEGRRQRMETHFSLRIPADLVERVVSLADEHLRDRYQPEKSLRLMESACARAVMEQPRAAALTETHVLQALEDFVGTVVIPGKPVPVAELSEKLREHVVGQDEVMNQLAEAVVAGRADNGWFLRPGPRGVFLFGGPTGVGKTETALQLAKLLGGGREALVRVDCQNLQGSGSGWESNTLTWRLLGVAPGYRGHTPGCRDGLLVRVRDFPECVLLFDEFEKADATVGRLMLRILDEGKAQDSEGNDLDFRRCFVVLTSNAGVTYNDEDRGSLIFSRPGSHGPGRPEANAADLQRDLLSTGLGQEFLGRVQHVFLFHGLRQDDVRRVAERQLNDLRDFARVRGKELDWDPGVIDYLARLWQKQHNLGARYLTSLVRLHVLDPLNVAASLGELTAEVGHIHIATAPSANGPAGRSERKREGNRLLIELS